MFQSIRASEIALRVGIAIVFIWFGIHKFVEPQYWLTNWMPDSIEGIARGLGIAPRDLMNLFGLFEILVALSLATGFFMRYFAAAAGVFLVCVAVAHGFTDATVRDIGLLGGLVSIVLWPQRTYV